MKIIKPGHLYEVDSMEGSKPQQIQFIEKEAREVPGSDRTAFITITDGTTNEEILRVVIDRLRTLGSKLPCRENAIAITKVEEALLWLQYRTQNRLEQGVENTPFPHIE